MKSEKNTSISLNSEEGTVDTNSSVEKRELE